MVKEDVVVGGIYVHFKNQEHKYRVIAIGQNEKGDKVVIYQALYPNEESEFWTRPVEHFLDQIEREEYRGPRFRLLEE
jgi:hypothetical protein